MVVILDLSDLRFVVFVGKRGERVREVSGDESETYAWRWSPRAIACGRARPSPRAATAGCHRGRVARTTSAAARCVAIRSAPLRPLHLVLIYTCMLLATQHYQSVFILAVCPC